VAAKQNAHLDDLRKLIPAVLGVDGCSALEKYLTEHSALPSPRGNLELIHAFADAIGEIITRPDPPVERIETLLDDWAALSLEAAPVNDPREILPAAAVVAYGQAAASRLDRWDAEMEKLRKAASDPRWRTREMVAAALQRMLGADWERTYNELACCWLGDDDPLVIRAAVAAVAEPALLTDSLRGMNALSAQAQAIGWLSRLPAARRRGEAVRTLRQALGYTVSVAVVPVPEAGFDLLTKLAASTDSDLRWILRENLKKSRLKPWADKVESLQASLA
jgi:hypothetical protein